MALTVAIQYPSFGPQHPPRLRAIAKVAPSGWRVVAMEMFGTDSDYDWSPVDTKREAYARCTAMDCPSAEGRKSARLKKAVFEALDRVSPDVLVVNGWGHRESRASFKWARMRKCPTVVLSDNVYENTRRYWWKEAAKKWVIRGCRAAFVAGRPQARYVQRLGIAPSAVFHPGSCVVDNEYWAREAGRVRRDPGRFRAELGLPERYFLCVARLARLKNIPSLVRAFGRHRDSVSTKHRHDLVVCGDGPELKAVRSLIESRGIQGVSLPGWRDTVELPAFYALASCFILASSYFEPWGLVVNEAMASGLPVLVSEKCGCAEDLVRNGHNGYVFNPRDEDTLARLMILIAESADLRAQMGQASERIIAGHSCEVGALNLWRAVEAARSGPC